MRVIGFFSPLHGPEQNPYDASRADGHKPIVPNCDPTPFYKIQCSSEQCAIQVGKNFSIEIGNLVYT